MYSAFEITLNEKIIYWKKLGELKGPLPEIKCFYLKNYFCS